MSKQWRVPLLKLRKISSEAIPNFFYAKKPGTVPIASFRARIQPKNNPDDYNPDDYDLDDYDSLENEGITVHHQFVLHQLGILLPVLDDMIREGWSNYAFTLTHHHAYSPSYTRLNLSYTRLNGFRALLYYPLIK